MGDFAGHEEAQCFFNARIVRHVHQPLIDDFCAGLRSNVGAEVGRRLTDRIDIGCRPRHAGGVGQRCAGAIQQAGDVRIVARTIDGPVQLTFFFNAFGHSAFGTLVQHNDDGADDFEVA